MTVANSSSEKFGAFNVDSPLEHREKERFLKDRLWFAFVDGRHRRSGSQNLTTSKQPGTKWIPQPILLTIFSALESEALMDRDPIKLSSLSRVHSGLVFQDTSVTTVIKSVIQYSKAFN